MHQLTNSPVKCVLLCFNCSLLTTVTQKSLQWKGDTGFELVSTGGKISQLIQIRITIVLCFFLPQPAQIRFSRKELFPQNIYLFPAYSLVFLNSDRRWDVIEQSKRITMTFRVLGSSGLTHCLTYINMSQDFVFSVH